MIVEELTASDLLEEMYLSKSERGWLDTVRRGALTQREMSVGGVIAVLNRLARLGLIERGGSGWQPTAHGPRVR